jgi:hypothetical protein
MRRTFVLIYCCENPILILLQSVTKSEVKRNEIMFSSFRFEAKRTNWKRKEKFAEAKQAKKLKRNEKLLEAKQSKKCCFNFALVGSKNFEAKEANFFLICVSVRNGSSFISFRFEAKQFYLRNQRTLIVILRGDMSKSDYSIDL